MNTLTKYQMVTDHMRYCNKENKPKHSLEIEICNLQGTWILDMCSVLK